MKVAMITNDFPPDCGGVGYHVYYLSRELVGMGHDVSVILRGRRDRSYDHEGIRVREVGVSGRPPLNIPAFGRKVERVLSAERVDIVHVHNTAMPSIICDCPVIVTAHCCVRGIIRHYYRPIRDFEGFMRNLLSPYYIHMERKLSRSTDKLLVVSDSLRGEFERHYGVDGDIVWNGVDTDAFDANGAGREDVVLFTGMFRAGKGLFDLLAVAGRLGRSHPGVRVVMAGDGPMKGRVRAAIRRDGLDNVETTGHLTHPELLGHYRRSMIYVLPSYYEGLPTTILEAMACRLPVVASNVSGIPEQVDEGVTGYMLRPGDVDGFYNRIVELLEDPAKRKSFGETGRKKVLERFTWPRIAGGILDKYRELA